MDAEFWHQRWQTNQIGFHESDGNTLLLQHFATLQLPKKSRIFLPLCGKTRDIAWLLGQGHQVAGCELSELAIQQLFADLNTVPHITESGSGKRYSSDGLDIFVGDFFELTTSPLGPVDLIYDRAALIALPQPMRQDYSRHLRSLTHNARQLLIVLQYDQAQMPGPPFSVSDDELRQHYEAFYNLQLLDDETIPGGLKGKCPAQEKLWILQPQDH